MDPSSLVRWRKRIEEKGVEFLLQQTIATAKDAGKLNKRDMAAEGVQLRQSYKRVSKKALVMQGRYARARQMKRARKQTKRLKTMLGRVIRDIRRKAPAPGVALEELLERAERLHAQQRSDKNKLYSVHEPDVECIAKGKAHKRSEFGCKVGVVRNWVIGVQALHDNPYDGHTLSSSLEQAERLIGWTAGEAYVDQGYRGHGYAGSTTIHVVDHRKKRLSKSEKRWRKRRAAIEPIIGHLKSDHRMLRNQLKGIMGDQINAMLAGVGSICANWCRFSCARFGNGCFSTLRTTKTKILNSRNRQ